MADTVIDLSKNNNFAYDIGHRVHVLLVDTPDGFRDALIRADSEGLIDDIARPESLEEADLAIFYYSDVEQFRNSKFFSDLEPLADRIVNGMKSASYMLGLKVSGQIGPRSLRLYFFNSVAAKAEFKAEGLEEFGVDASQLECLAARIYAISLIDDAEGLLTKSLKDC